MGSALMFTSVSHHHLPKKEKRKKKSPPNPRTKKGTKKKSRKRTNPSRTSLLDRGELEREGKEREILPKNRQTFRKNKKANKKQKKTQKAKKKKKDEMQRHCSKTRGGWPAARREEACGPQALRSNGLFLLLVEEKGEWTFFTRRTT